MYRSVAKRLRRRPLLFPRSEGSPKSEQATEHQDSETVAHVYKAVWTVVEDIIRLALLLKQELKSRMKQADLRKARCSVDGSANARVELSKN